MGKRIIFHVDVNSAFLSWSAVYRLEELGEEHLRTGKLIVYTSADSVFQIAAHESVVPPLTLWDICRQARRVPMSICGTFRQS